MLTHLPEELQRPWIEELARVTRRDGHVLVTTHGVLQAEAYLEGDELARFHRGDFVGIETAAGTAAGTNAYSAFHPLDYVRRSVSDLFELIVARPGGPPTQSIIFTHDVYLLRRA